MKLFGRQNKTVEVPPELQPYYEGSASTAQPALWRWGRWVIVVLLVIGIGLAVYFLGPWNSTDTSKNKPSSPPAASSSGGVNGNSAVPPPSGSQSGNSTSTPSTNNDNKSTQPVGSAAGQKAPQNGSNQQLANTGPGDTVAVFAGAIVVGVVVYELYLRRRATR
ncbi:MAG TPA: hypothetical protein VHD60_01650 [Candidatus Saccharimonadales bacterium]|nr:hypothetical protein [Candidatus Saccharimonadales bacterium]